MSQRTADQIRTLVRAGVSHVSDADVEAITQFIVSAEAAGTNSCLWHAASQVMTTKCHCFPCEAARKVADNLQCAALGDAGNGLVISGSNSTGFRAAVSKQTLEHERAEVNRMRSGIVAHTIGRWRIIVRNRITVCCDYGGHQRTRAVY